jgi:hypothetical protein
MKAKKKAQRKVAGMFVVLIVLQGRPLIIMDEEHENTKVWPSFDEAMAFTMSGHIGVTASERVMVIDCNTGETEVL